MLDRYSHQLFIIHTSHRIRHHLRFRICRIRHKHTAHNIHVTNHILVYVHVFICVNDRIAVRTKIFHGVTCLRPASEQLVSHASNQSVPQTIRIRQDDGTIRILSIGSTEPFIDSCFYIVDFINLNTLRVGIVDTHGEEIDIT
ncbi:hypothetical protein D3C74_331070 [compost metagenome]